MEQSLARSRFSEWLLVATAVAVVVSHFCGSAEGQATGSFRVAMPGVIPTEDDNYLCAAFSLQHLVANVDGPIYINTFEADSNANKAHHIILQSCRVLGDQAKPGEPWDCRHHQTCEEGEEILFAWARRAPPTLLPEGVTFKVDPRQTPFLVLQVHYAHRMNEKDTSAVQVQFQHHPSRYTAGIYLMMRTSLTIPGHNAVTHGDMNCIVREEMHPFAFRTHAHRWGTVITGYKYDTQTNEMIEFARGNPQWPQAFYPVTTNLTLVPGDFFVGRCTYNTTENPQTTFIGSSSADEMCNLYIMYYGERAHFEQCFDEQSAAVSRKLPPDSDLPPPRNIELENVAMGRNKGYLDSDVNEGGYHRKGQSKLQDQLENIEEIKIGMPGVIPGSDDAYLCTSFQSWNLTNNREVYIRAFMAEATALKAHHIILQRCDNPPQPPGQIWNCIHHSTCNGQAKILFAWAKDAPPTTLPEDVGFHIGQSSHEHLVLQVHYSHSLQEPDFTALKLKITENKPKYSAGIYLLWSGYVNIPPHQPKVHGDINCMVTGLSSPMYLFAFRTHAHALATLITGYKFRNNEITQVARGDPQKPQTFYTMPEVQEVQNGDFLSARCTYNTMRRDTPTKIGPTSGDEMCNLYIMYYTESETEDYQTCTGIQSEHLVAALPPNSDEASKETSNIEVPIPYSNSVFYNEDDVPSKEKKQYGKVIPGFGQYNPGSIYQQPQQIPPLQYPNMYSIGGYQNQNQNPYSNYYVPMSGDGDIANQQYDPSFAYSNGLAYYPSQTPELESTTFSSTSSMTETPSTNNPSNYSKKTGKFRDGKNSNDAGLYTVPSWPPAETLQLIGQPTGITLDAFDNPVIFHRGDRIWDGNTFDSNNVYTGDMTAPIPTNTILTLDKNTGKVLNAWGAGMFFLPHMITIDSQNNVWVTDVAMHQVFHFPPYGGSGEKKLPDIVLGTPFQPGNDDNHYCKPTSVAVMKDSRTFFVADGYCNSRIIQYVYDIMPDGHHNVTKIISWGIANGAGVSFSKSPYSFNVPHGLALAENKKLICVADRENGRIQCFNTDDGKFKKSLQPKEFGSTIYSVAYAPQTGNVYAIGGPENFGVLTGKRTQGYIINLESGKLLNTFNGVDEGFKMPHDVAVNQDGSFVYVVEINPFRIWKLTTGQISSGLNPTGSTNNPQNGLSPTDYIKQINLKSFENIVPSTTVGVGIVIASVLLTCIISICISCRKCRKRGKGKTAKQSKAYKKDNGKLDLGDLLGRSKDGFKPLKTDEDDAVILSSDSDVEDFSVPALHA